MQSISQRHEQAFPSYLKFRKSILPHQMKIAMWCCGILASFAIYNLIRGFIFHSLEYIPKVHLIMMYVPIGSLALLLLLSMSILRQSTKVHWRILESLTYIAVLILPYWGLVMMNFSAIENRNLSFLLWIIGIITACGALYIAPPYSACNIILVTVLTLYSMYRFHYSFGASGPLNLFILQLICIAISILRFVDGHSEFRKNELLGEAVAEADHANAAKGTFLAHMSHEIRNPINTVLGMDELILREAQDPHVLSYARNIKTSGNMLLSLINDILDFSKIEAGKMLLLPNSYQLSSTLLDLINSVYLRAKDKGLEFKININPATPVNLYGDEIRVKQIVTNLLTNAVKYTPSGSITFRVDYDKQSEDTIELVISVEDTGIGIKQEDMDKLTQSFERIEEARNHSIEGTGLGINITTQLLQLMDGHLEVSSQYGIGSKFTAYIPQKAEDSTPIGAFDSSYEYTSSIMEKYQCTFTAPEARILIVDDSTTNRMLAKALLNPTQIQVDLAESGQMFLEMAKKNSYHIIFLDHRMPDMDGIEALHKMRQMKYVCKDAVMIALTANAVSGAKDYYLKEGFDDFLSKPIDIKKYEKMIQQHLPANLVHINTSSTEPTTSSPVL